VLYHGFERPRRFPNKKKGTADLHGLAKFSLYRDITIVDDMKIRRLGLADHIVGMEEDRIP
jgi:hypothetical protein